MTFDKDVTGGTICTATAGYFRQDYKCLYWSWLDTREEEAVVLNQYRQTQNNTSVKEREKKSENILTGSTHC